MWITNNTCEAIRNINYEQQGQQEHIGKHCERVKKEQLSETTALSQA